MDTMQKRDLARQLWLVLNSSPMHAGLSPDATQTFATESGRSCLTLAQSVFYSTAPSETALRIIHLMDGIVLVLKISPDWTTAAPAGAIAMLAELRHLTGWGSTNIDVPAA